MYTWKFPRVVAIKIEKSNEFDIEALALHLTAKVKLYEFFFSWVEAKARHHHIMLMIISISISIMTALLDVLVVGVVFFMAHPAGCCNCHKLITGRSRTNCDQIEFISAL